LKICGNWDDHEIPALMTSASILGEIESPSSAHPNVFGWWFSVIAVGPVFLFGRPIVPQTKTPIVIIIRWFLWFNQRPISAEVHTLLTEFRTLLLGANLAVIIEVPASVHGTLW
jgi:hypothetical protein